MVFSSVIGLLWEKSVAVEKTNEKKSVRNFTEPARGAGITIPWGEFMAGVIKSEKERLSHCSAINANNQTLRGESDPLKLE